MFHRKNKNAFYYPSLPEPFNYIVLIYTHTHVQPRDPCPAYPVESYVFNISEDNNNFIASVYHMGNASVNISGSDYGLLHNQVYQLTVEAVNAVGSTHSEEILLCKSTIQLLCLQ